jgi:hypothetical protein
MTAVAPVPGGTAGSHHRPTRWTSRLLRMLPVAFSRIGSVRRPVFEEYEALRP